MVIRKRHGSAYKSWQMRDGVAIGWRDGSEQDDAADPDHYRRLLAKNYIEPSKQTPPFNGEQTHPLHTQLVRDENGRNRAMVYGYVPLSGTVEAELGSKIEGDAQSQTSGVVSAKGQLGEHEWPFGSWDGVSDSIGCDCTGSLTEVATHLCEHFNWTNATGYQVNVNSKPTRAMAGFIRTLMDRYQIFDAQVPNNEALRTLCQQWVFNRTTSNIYSQKRSLNLLSYLQQNVDALQTYFAEIDRQNLEISKEVGADALATPLDNYPPLPNNPGYLTITENQAADARELLVMRAEKAEQLMESSLPLPRYTQGEGDQYFIKTFVRYESECGKERIAWGPESPMFRVVSPLDAQATRPTAIQLPELSDVKKGFAKGVTFLTPKSMADAIASVVPDMDMKKQKKKSRLDACLGVSISFSIPIITICAMILLMIVLNLLNLIFRWLPWAIMVLPRKCVGGGNG